MSISFKNHWLRAHVPCREEGYITYLAYRAMKKCGYGNMESEVLHGITFYRAVRGFAKKTFSCCIKIGRQKYYDQMDRGLILSQGNYNYAPPSYGQCIECHMLEHLCPDMAIKRVFMLLEKDKETWNKYGRNRYLTVGEAFLQKETLFQPWKFELLERLGESTNAYRFFKKIYAQQ